MRDHLSKCKPYLTHQKTTGIETTAVRMAEFKQKEKSNKQQHLNIPTLTPEKKAKIDEKFALAAYANGLPFTVFESPEMREAFKELHPAYTPPNRKALSGPLLDQVYEKVKVKVDELLSSLQCINIVTDESTDINSTRINNLSIHTPHGAIFWSSDDVGATQNTAENLAQWVKGKMNEISEGNLLRINSLATDTCQTMFSTWGFLREMPELKHCFFIPCDSHGIYQFAFTFLILCRNSITYEGSHYTCPQFQGNS